MVRVAVAEGTEQSPVDVLEALAARIRDETSLEVDVVKPTQQTLRKLPRVVLSYLDSPWELGSSHYKVVHTIEIAIVAAPLESYEKARKFVLKEVADVKRALYEDRRGNGGMILIANPQTTLVPEGSQAVRAVAWTEVNIRDALPTQYVSAIIIVRYVEKGAELF